MEREHLSAFLEDVRREVRRQESQDATARCVRNAMRPRLKNDAFLVDCVEGALDTMPARPGEPWLNPPLWDDDECSFSLRLFFWPAGFANRAHQHEDWTVTGVFHNDLTFHTYQEQSGSLTEDRRIASRAGDVGYISTPCIHNVSNDSARTSISMHVFSGARTAAGRGRSHWYGGRGDVRPKVVDDGPRALGAFVTVAAGCADARRLPILDRLFALGGPAIKLAAAKAMASVDAGMAAGRLKTLADLCPPHVARELDRLSTRLVAAGAAPAGAESHRD